MTGRNDTDLRIATLESLERRHRTGVVIEQVGLTARVIVMCVMVAFLGWCAKEAVSALAGRVTGTNIVLQFFGFLEVSIAVAWGAAAAAAIWGFRERSLRRSTTKRMSDRVEELELLIDPGRTSSNLSRTGETNPKDK